MKIENYTYISSNRVTTIEYSLWLPDTQPKAIVQIVHGMSEHIGRYNRFASFLVENGYAVCANNHLGHGGSLLGETFGYFGEEGSYINLIEDVKILTSIVKERFSYLNVFILGHSMGSFITRLYMTKHSNLIDGVLISGTSGPNFDAEYPAYMLAKTLRKLKGSKYVSKRLDKMVVGSFSRRYQGENESNWISSDESQSSEYYKDELCGFPFTVGGYSEMFTMLRLISHPRWASLIPQQLPILIFSGENDPVGQYGKGVKTVYDRLVQTGQDNVELILYPNGRHEMLNEHNYLEVFSDILNWLDKTIKQQNIPN